MRTDFTLLKKELVEEKKQQFILKVRLANQQRLQTEKEAQQQELQQTHTAQAVEWQQQMDTMKKHSEHEFKNYRDLLEDQRREFMMTLKELETAKEKGDKALAKIETELAQARTQLKEMSQQGNMLKVV